MEASGGMIAGLVAALLIALPVVAMISALSEKARRSSKALEMGVSPPAGLDWPTAAVCIAIGAGVPIGSFAMALLASLMARVSGITWVAAALVSYWAIGSARKLANRCLDRKPEAKGWVHAGSNPLGKPEFDPEAFDVVGRRG